MKISVVTVTYNGAKTIRRTIESVLDQNYSDLDYIIVDGGSMDGTVNIIKEYSDKISYWCSEKDSGIYDAMNKGIAKSKGDIIAFMNSDDWYERDVFEKVAKCFQNTDADLVYGDYNIVWAGNKFEKVCLDNLNLRDLYYRYLFCHQAMFMKRELFNTVGLYNVNYKIAADYEWVLRAYVAGAKFEHLSELICYFTFGGVSAICKKAGTEENRTLKLSLLPDDLKKEYLPKINQAYISEYNNIFFNIYNALLSGNEDLIQKIHMLLEEWNNNAIVWGAGRIGKQITSFLAEAKISLISIIDNDSQKWGSIVNGVMVKKPYIEQNKSVKAIIAVKDGIDEIKEQLINLGFLEENIVSYLEFKELIIDEIDN